MIKEWTFNMGNLSGYEEMSLMLEMRGSECLNKLIMETSHPIRIEFYANSVNQNFKDYMSNVRGKIINYSPRAINHLIIYQLLLNVVSKIRGVFGYLIGWVVNAKEFGNSGDEWVIVHEKHIKLKTREIRPIPKVWASFLVQILEVSSIQ